MDFAVEPKSIQRSLPCNSVGKEIIPLEQKMVAAQQIIKKHGVQISA
jgi:hypothetical protein